jgi:hypothetical protein
LQCFTASLFLLSYIHRPSCHWLSAPLLPSTVLLLLLTPHPVAYLHALPHLTLLVSYLPHLQSPPYYLSWVPLPSTGSHYLLLPLHCSHFSFDASTPEIVRHVVLHFVHTLNAVNGDRLQSSHVLCSHHAGGRLGRVHGGWRLLVCE